MAIYYISATGNDNNNGTTIDTPWQTLTKVNAATFTAGDSILFNKGDTFYGSITINQPGASGSPITFSSYGTGVNPIITGFTSVTAWTDKGSNIWESTDAVSTLSTCNMVTIGGVNTAMGRYPKVTETNKGYLPFQSYSGLTSITSSSLTGTPDWTGAEVVIRVAHFLIGRSIITSQSGETLNFNSNSTISELTNNFGFFIQNDVKCLTQQNDWYYNSSSKKIKIYSTSQPTNVNVASVDQLITIHANYLIFNNIDFTGANSVAFYAWDANPRWHDVTIQNCNFTNIGVSAIYILINNFLFQYNTISESNRAAISTTYGNNVTVKNNSIQNIGLNVGMRNGSEPYSISNNAVQTEITTTYNVENNVIKNVAYNAISFYGDDILIKNNFIDGFCTELDDGGAIYTFTGARTSITQAKITGNIIINGVGGQEGTTSSSGLADGIYLDERSKNVEVSYNSVADLSYYGIFLNTSAGYINVHDNTVYNAAYYLYSSTYWGTESPLLPPVGNQLKYNILVAKTKDSNWNDANQKCIMFYFVRNGSSTPANDLMLASTTLDYNYYARPISQTEVVRWNSSDWNSGFQTLAQWQAYSGQDLHTLGSPEVLTTVNDFQFEYNETLSAKVVTLTEPMIDVTGAKYVGSITLQPFTSIVMMKDYNPAIQTTKFVITSNNKLIVSNNQVLTEMI